MAELVERWLRNREARFKSRHFDKIDFNKLFITLCCKIQEVPCEAIYFGQECKEPHFSSLRQRVAGFGGTIEVCANVKLTPSAEFKLSTTVVAPS